MGRFFRRGVTEVHFLPAVADPAAPTRVEITAGTDLSEDSADISGWEFTGSRIPTPNFKSSFTPQITGEDTVGDAAIAFYDRDDDETIRTALAKGTAGFLVFMPYGDNPGDRAEVWPIQTQSVSDIYTLGNEAARFNVGFAVTDPPEQDAVLPAP